MGIRGIIRPVRINKTIVTVSERIVALRQQVAVEAGKVSKRAGGQMKAPPTTVEIVTEGGTKRNGGIMVKITRAITGDAETFTDAYIIAWAK